MPRFCSTPWVTSGVRPCHAAVAAWACRRKYRLADQRCKYQRCPRSSRDDRYDVTSKGAQCVFFEIGRPLAGVKIDDDSYFWLDLGWLVVLVVTVALPLVLDAVGRLTYFTSLALWGIPILYLWPVFRSITADGTGRRRRALYWTAGTIVALGVVLDFVLGYLTLRFPGCSETAGTGPYVWCLPAVGGKIPVEELLFYAMGPVAIVLVYACADERWLSRYNPKDDLLDLKLIQVSPRLVVVAVGCALAALALWRVNGTFPTYLAFIAAGAVVPALSCTAPLAT